MQHLHNKLPKDLTNIVGDFLSNSKKQNKSKYDKVVDELEICIIGALQNFLLGSDDRSFCFNEYDERAWLDCRCCYFGHKESLIAIHLKLFKD